jgi:hypothetical protein
MRVCLLLALLIPAWLLAGLEAQAQEGASVALSETNLEFRGLVGQPLQRSFALTVAGGAVQNVTLVPHDLVDSASGAAIASGQVRVDPQSVASVEGVQPFLVTVAGHDKPGHYVGQLEIRYDGQPARAPLAVTLDVTLAASSEVDATVDSKNLTLEIVPSWFSVPFGRPSASSDSAVQGQVTISLVQSGEGPATVEAGTVLSMRGPRNLTLPEQAVRVVTTMPLSIPAQGAANLQVVGGGRGLNAGEYNGVLHLAVSNQAPLQVPLKVLVKDGPLLPLIVLALGLVVGAFLALWNRDGRARFELQRRIQRLQDELESPELLQQEEQERADRELSAAVDAMVKGDSVERITQQVDALAKFVEDTQAAAAKLEQDARPLETQLRKLRVCNTYRARLLEGLQALRIGVREGSYESLGAATGVYDRLQSQVAELQGAVERFAALGAADQAKIRPALDAATDFATIDGLIKGAEAVSAGLEELPEEYQARVRGWLDDAASLGEMEGIMQRAQAVVEQYGKLPPAKQQQIDGNLAAATTLEEMEAIVGVPAPKRGFEAVDYQAPGAVPEEEAEEEKAQALQRAWTRTTLVLKTRRALAFGIAFLFTLVVGWITLYAASPTFGADPREYVTLFLWGVSGTVIGGQAINLQSIYDRAQEEAGGEGE